jgi:uncharacterized protein YidB (DUF937 family)
MSRGFPSMLALLGLVAVAGYQHRDKITELLNGSGRAPDPQAPRQPSSGIGRVLDGAREAGSTGGPLAFLGAGIRELVDRFNQSGRGAVANSWVSRGTNQPITADELKAAIGPEALSELTQRTGLSESELLNRLSQNLPAAVDQYTPEGRIA